MKQTVQVQRIESKTMVLDVVQPLTKETLTAVVNGHAQGITSPTAETQVSHSVGAWRVLRASPECECRQPPAKAASTPVKSNSKKGK